MISHATQNNRLKGMVFLEGRAEARGHPEVRQGRVPGHAQESCTHPASLQLQFRQRGEGLQVHRGLSRRQDRRQRRGTGRVVRHRSRRRGSASAWSREQALEAVSGVGGLGQEDRTADQGMDEDISEVNDVHGINVNMFHRFYQCIMNHDDEEK